MSSTALTKRRVILFDVGHRVTAALHGNLILDFDAMRALAGSAYDEDRKHRRACQRNQARQSARCRGDFANLQLALTCVPIAPGWPVRPESGRPTTS